MRTDLLTEPLPGLDEALAAVDALDRVLVDGLLRPQPTQAADLDALARAVAGTPLASRVAEAAEKAAAGTAGEDHFVALAAARTALLGSVHDALTERVDEATGRTRTPCPPLTPGEPPAPNLPAAARSWLSDLARAGWHGIDHDLVAGSAQIVAAMLPVPELRRLATLMDGFAAELAACCPGATLEHVPTRRWADLWSRALLLAHPPADRGALSSADTLTGRLLPLGVDLHEHPSAAQAQIHAVFEPADGGPPRLVRASVSAPKPDTVIEAGVWQLLRPHLSLLAIAAEGRCAQLVNMPVTVDGDLLWDDTHARPDEDADAFATARLVLAGATAPARSPLDRHPAAIAEPVLVEGYTVEDVDGTPVFTVAGSHLAVDTDRLPTASPLTPDTVAASTACIGLLRWDAGVFRIQPLAVEGTVKRKPVAVHAGAWAGGSTDKLAVRAEKAATHAVTVLRERAGKLLRK